jgi:hypothetical protein
MFDNVLNLQMDGFPRLFREVALLLLLLFTNLGCKLSIFCFAAPALCILKLVKVIDCIDVQGQTTIGIDGIA